MVSSLVSVYFGSPQLGNLTYKNTRLPLLFEILGNICIAAVCEPGQDVINFEINLTFLIKPFFYMTKKSKQIFKYLENEKSL